MAKLTLKTNLIKPRLQKAFTEAVEEFGDVTKEAMDLVIYDFDRPTKRKANPSPGAIVNSPRTITDTGELKESLEIYNYNLFRSLLIWTAPHAESVFYGFKRKDGSSAPPRDWILIAMALRPFKDILAEKIKNHLQK